MWFSTHGLCLSLEQSAFLLNVVNAGNTVVDFEILAHHRQGNIGVKNHDINIHVAPLDYFTSPP